MDVTFTVTGGGSGTITYQDGSGNVSKSLTAANKRIAVTANGHTEVQATSDGATLNFTNTLNWGANGIDVTIGTEANLVAGENAVATRTNTGGTGANDLSVAFNQDGSAKIQVNAQDATSTGLGLTASTNSWVSDSDIDSAITQLDSARDTLRSQTREFSTSLGVIQTREDFTSEFVNALQAGADKLTLADGNEEAANMLALQTRQQLGIQALSMASQSAQSVLSLFR